MAARLQMGVANKLQSEAILAEKKARLLEAQIKGMEATAEDARRERDTTRARLLESESDSEHARKDLEEAENSLHEKEEALLKATEMQTVPPDMLEHMDLEVDPCSDFFEYACGRFKRHAEIPDYLSSWSLQWDEVRLVMIKKVVKLLEKDDGEAGKYYQSCMNEDAIEEGGLGPLEVWVKTVEEIHDPLTLTQFIATMALYNRGVLFSWMISVDGLHPTQHMFEIIHTKLSLPGPGWYLNEGDRYTHRQELFRTRVSQVFRMLGQGDEEAMEGARLVLAIETELAKHRLSGAYVRSHHAQRITVQELSSLCPGIVWEAFFGALGLEGVGMAGNQTEGAPPGPTLAVQDVNNMQSLQANVLDKFSPRELRAYLRWKVARMYYKFLPHRFKKAVSYAVSPYDHPKMSTSPRWKGCYYTVVKALPEAASKLFVDAYFESNVMGQAADMLTKVRDAFAHDLSDADWMDSTTFTRALDKLGAMGFEVGYPDGWGGAIDSNPLTLYANKFFDNHMKISVRTASKERAELYERARPDSWAHAAVNTNGYYNRKKNTLFIPAGMLQPPFFDPAFPPPRNYGSLGSILGHEMTHGFDDQGSMYDAGGMRVEWWDARTLQTFRERMQCISRQFSSYEFDRGMMLDGNLTLGETIADNGGMRMSYGALKQELGDKMTETDSKLFFLSFAQMWCDSRKPHTHPSQSVHPPKRWRVIGTLQDSEAFAEAYQCPKGSFMNPPDKCVVW